MNTAALFAGVVQLLLLLLSISAHEAAHAWVAERCGDPTGRLLGSLSLNPLRHLDPFGSVLLPAMCIVGGLPVFGWGRPTRFQSRNMRRPYFHTLLVNAAGPAMNLLLALLATVAIAFAVPALGGDSRKAAFFALINRVDSGSTQLAAFPVLYTLVHLATLNAFLAVFNLLPVPPLDGGYIALQVLPADWAAKLAAVRPYGLMIGIALAMLGVPLLVLPFLGLLNFVITYL